MSQYWDDVKEKSAMVRSSRGTPAARSKKVRLPSDSLTPGQLAKLNGPVKTYRFVPDVPAKELETWPEDLREEYYKRFRR